MAIPMNFGRAWHAALNGARIRREFWNDMCFVMAQTGQSGPFAPHGSQIGEYLGVPDGANSPLCRILPQATLISNIYTDSAQEAHIQAGWLPCQDDLFAVDWFVVE